MRGIALLLVIHAAVFAHEDPIAPNTRAILPVDNSPVPGFFQGDLDATRKVSLLLDPKSEDQASSEYFYRYAEGLKTVLREPNPWVCNGELKTTNLRDQAANRLRELIRKKHLEPIPDLGFPRRPIGGNNATLDEAAVGSRFTVHSHRALHAVFHSLFARGNVMAASFYFDGWWDDHEGDLKACNEEALAFALPALAAYYGSSREREAEKLFETVKACTKKVTLGGKEISILEWKTQSQTSQTIAPPLTLQKWVEISSSARANEIRRAVAYSGRADRLSEMLGIPPNYFCEVYAWNPQEALESGKPNRVNKTLRLLTMMPNPPLDPLLPQIFHLDVLEGDIHESLIDNLLKKAGPKAIPILTKKLKPFGYYYSELALSRMEKLGADAALALPELRELGELSKQIDLTDATQLRVHRIFRLMKEKAAPLIPDIMDQISKGDLSNSPLLGTIGPKAIPSLFKMLESEDPIIQSHALKAIAESEPGENVVFLKTLTRLLEEQPYHRHNALLALGALGEAAFPALPAIERAIAKDPEAAFLTMAKTGPKSFPLLYSRLRMREQDALHAFQAIGPKAEPALDTLLSHVQTVPVEAEELDRQDELIKAIGAIGPSATRAIPKLAQVMKTGSAVQRNYAAEALRLIGPAAPAPESFKAEEITNFEIAEKIVKADRTRDFIPQLTKLLSESQDLKVQSLLIKAFSELDEVPRKTSAVLQTFAKPQKRDSQGVSILRGRATWVYKKTLAQ